MKPNVSIARRQCKGGSASGLKRHLKQIHSIDHDLDGGQKSSTQTVTGDNVAVSSGQKNKKLCNRSMTASFTPKITLSERIAWYAAQDGFTIHAISKSLQIHNHLSSKGFLPPKSPTTAMEHIMKYHSYIAERTKKEIMENGIYSVEALCTMPQSHLLQILPSL